MYKASILIVEDNELVVLELKDRLKKMGYDISATASNGLNAIKKAILHQPDLIMMDIRLKGKIDGIDASTEIRNSMDVPIVFLTAHTDDDTLQRAKITEPYGYIIKPFDELELKTTLEMALYKHAMKKKLKESEERFRRTFELDSIGNSLTSVDGKFVNVNNMLCKMLGYTKDELISQNFTSITHPDDIEISLESMRKLLSGETESCNIEKRFIKKDGSNIWINVIATLLKDSKGNPVHFITHLIDISGRKLTELALRKSEERFSKIFSKSLVPLTLSRFPDRKIIEANDEYCRLIGFIRSDIIGHTSVDLGIVDQRTSDKIMDEVRKNGFIQNLETLIRTRDGNCRNIIYSSEPIEIGDEQFLLSISIDITERKHAEEMSARNEHLFRLFVEHSPASIAMFDRNMKYIITSSRFLTDYEIGQQNIIGRSHYEIFPEIPERWKEIHKRCLAGETIRDPEDSFPRANGKLDWIRWEICPWYEHNNEIGGIILFSEVISERKNIIEALRKSEEQYRQLADSAPIPVAVASLATGKLLYLNNNAFELLGFTFEGNDFHDYILTDFYVIPKLYDVILKILKKEGHSSNFEIELKKVDGRQITVLTSSLITSFENEPAIFSSFYDITSRKRAEEMLAISEVRYRRLFETAKDGILILDYETGVIVDVNPFLSELFGYPYDKFIGKTIWEIGFFKDIVSNKDKLLELHKKIYVRFEDLPLQTASGQKINVEIISNAYLVNHHKVVQFNIRDITERKRMEATVRESEERFRMVFENMFDGISIYLEDTDPYKRKLIDCNEQYAIMAGRSREELLQLGSTMNLQVTLDEYANKNRLESIDGGAIYHGSFSWIRPDEKENIVEYSSRPIKWQGKTYSIGIDRDITERSRLLENQRKLSTAIEQSPVSIVITNIKGDIEYVNPKFTQITGYAYDEVHNQNPRILKSGEHTQEFYKNLWQTIKSGKEWSGVLHNKKKDGKLFWESAIISPIKDEACKITHFVAVKEDITERVEIEKELKKYREQLEELVGEKTEQLTKQNVFFRTLIDTIPNPIYVKDREFKYTEVNKAFEEYFNINRENILGKSFLDIMPAETAALIRQIDEQLLIDHKTVIYESAAQIKEGRTIPIMVYKSSFGLPGKDLEGIAALVIDISKQKEMEETTTEALRKEKELNVMKSNFISMTSHEFRTPLTTILSSTDLLERYHTKWEESKITGHYKKIQDSVKYMTAMLDEVLIISKSERGNINFNPSSVNLEEFASEIIEQVRMQALPGHNIIYDYKLPYQNISADPQLLNHILNNLLTNAVKFSPKGGDVNLTVEDENEYIKFTVKDNGIGIPQEDIKNLFEPFFRAQNSAGIKGTGLGLSIVKKYVQLHNGEISIESDPGKGTRFFVKIKRENYNN